jgi:hypothetical protein
MISTLLDCDFLGLINSFLISLCQYSSGESFLAQELVGNLYYETSLQKRRARSEAAVFGHLPRYCTEAAKKNITRECLVMLTRLAQK